MNSPTIVILSIVFGFLTCSDMNMRTNADPEKPAQVVQQYVAFARAGEFDKIESVTALQSPEEQKRESDAILAEARKEKANSRDPNGLTVMPDPDGGANAILEWVREDFAASIHDLGQSIASVQKEAANKTEARVEILLGNEKGVHPLPWVFLLRKVENKWKIYNITTAGADLPPLE